LKEQLRLLRSSSGTGVFSRNLFKFIFGFYQRMLALFGGGSLNYFPRRARVFASGEFLEELDRRLIQPAICQADESAADGFQAG
jgi:hypothetical protein